MYNNQVKNNIYKSGKLILPYEFINNAGICKGSLVEFFIKDDALIIKKFGPKCIFCNRMKELKSYKGKKVCIECIKELKERSY